MNSWFSITSRDFSVSTLTDFFLLAAVLELLPPPINQRVVVGGSEKDDGSGSLESKDRFCASERRKTRASEDN